MSKLGSAEDGGSVSGLTKDGRSVERKLVVGDRIAETVARWRRAVAGSGAAYDTLAPDAERAKARAALGTWLKAQFALVCAGRPHELRAPEPAAMLARGASTHPRLRW